MMRIFCCRVIVRGILLALVCQLVMLGSAFAQDEGNDARDVYAALDGVLSAYEQIVSEYQMDDMAGAVSSARKLLDMASDEDLATLSMAIPEIEDLSEEAFRLEVALMYDAKTVEPKTVLKSAGLPSASYPPPPCKRYATWELQIAYNVFLAAEVVKEEAGRVCDESIAGFNGSLACIVTDGIFFVAKGVYDNIVICDDGFASADIEFSYLRLGHIHTDLQNAEANLTAQVNENQVEINENQVEINENQVEINENEVKLDQAITLILANANAIAANRAAIEEVRVILCDVMRLLHTPEGRRSSDCEFCADNAAYPFDFPEKGTAGTPNN